MTMELNLINLPRIFPQRSDYQKAKRLVDILLCILSFPVVAPVFLLSMLAIYLDSGRPIFFVQERIGKGGRPFKIYKFRSLKNNHDQNQDRSFMKAYVRGDIQTPKPGQQSFKPSSDQQMLRVGSFLRKTSLDELPQLINVLKGEMSIVGPRPNVPWEVDEYHAWHFERLEVLPGITGLAQVNGRSGILFDAIVRHDIRYIEKQSIALDILILWQTVRAVLVGKNAG